MMKTCYKCGEEKPLTEFHKNKTKPDGLTAYCKQCKKEYNKKHYIERGHVWKDTRADSREKTKAECNDWLFKYLSSNPCVDCGNSDIRVLQFDHLRDKSNNVSSMRTNSLELVKAEVAKCEVRCSNCHDIKTIERMGGNWKTRMLERMHP